MEFTMRVANRVILVRCIYPGTYNMCMPYWATENAVPDIEINIDERLIRTEADRIGQTGRQRLNAKTVEKLLVHKLISEELLSFDTLLIHGAVVALHGAAYMFTAKSGIGKTTHVQNWLESIAGAYVVNGDKPFIIVRKADELPLACGSPWAGKENMQTNTVVPLKAIILMERAEENHMERVSFTQAFPFLFQQVFHPESVVNMRKTLSLMQRMNTAVSFWRFQCNNFKDDCFKVTYEALVTQNEG